MCCYRLNTFNIRITDVCNNFQKSLCKLQRHPIPWNVIVGDNELIKVYYIRNLWLKFMAKTCILKWLSWKTFDIIHNNTNANDRFVQGDIISEVKSIDAKIFIWRWKNWKKNDADNCKIENFCRSFSQKNIISNH